MTRGGAQTTPERIDDPVAELSPTARRLVSAARRLLARGGFEALTVEAVAAEAGTYRDAVRYYFGGKAAFIATVVDALAHDQSLEGSLRTRGLPPGGERVRALVDADRRLTEDLDSFRDFFTILPHALRDDELRERVARLYDWYRVLYVRALDGGDPARTAALQAHAHLMAAMADGLAVQKLLDPAGVDLEALYGLWARMLERSLGDFAGVGVGPSPVPDGSDRTTP
jgi:AcrR family transcriptional regulator